MSNCNYKFGDKVFTSVEDLNNFLLSNKHQIGLFSDIVYSSRYNTKQQEIMAILDERAIAAREVLSAKHRAKIDRTFDSYDVTPSNDQYISVLNAIKEFRQPNGDRLNPVFNEENHKKQLADQLKTDNPGYSAAEIDKIIEDIYEGYVNIAKAGVLFHHLAKRYFSNFYNEPTIADFETFRQDLIVSYQKKEFELTDAINRTNRISEKNALGAELDEVRASLNMFQTIESRHLEAFLDQLKLVKDSFNQKFGKNYKIYNEYPIVDEDHNLIGVIDMVIVDSDGVIHILDYKFSSSRLSEWKSPKRNNYKYQLGFYRQILANYGLNVANSQLLLVPFTFQDFKKDTFSGLEYTGYLYDLNEHNDLTFGSSSKYDNINYNLPLKPLMSYVNPNFLKDHKEKTSTLLPSFSDDLRTDTTLFDNWAKNKLYKKNGKFRVYNRNQAVDFETEAEAIALLREIYIKQHTEKHVQVENIVYRLGKAMKSGDHNAIWTNFNPNAKQGWFNIHMKKYTDAAHEIIENKELLSQGIILVRNKFDDQVDVIIIDFNDLNQDVKYAKGTTMLGDYEKDDYHLQHNTGVLKAKYGNVVLMKAMLALNDVIPDIFRGSLRLGDIRVYNPAISHGLTAERDSLLYTFNRLFSLSKTKGDNNFANGKIKISSNLELLRTAIINAHKLNKRSEAFNEIHSEFFKSPIVANNAIQELTLLRNQLENRFPQFRNVQREQLESLRNTPEFIIYQEITNSLMYFSGQQRYQEFYDPDQYLSGGFLNIFKNGWQGTMLDSIGTIESLNARQMNTFVKNAHQLIRNDLEKFRDEANVKINKFKEASGYGRFQQNILGAQNHIYRNLYREVDGVLDGTLMFKDPDDMNTQLEPHEREFLRYALWEINKERFDLTDPNSTAAQEAKLKERYYHVPLMEATKESKWQSEEGRAAALQRTKEKFDPKRIKEEFDRGVQQFNNLEHKEGLVRARQDWTMYDMMEYGETNRDELLTSREIGYFETNVEQILYRFKDAKIKRRRYNEVLPLLKANLAAIIMDSEFRNIPLHNVEKYINDYVKNRIFNESIVPEAYKKIAQIAGGLQQITSVAALGFSVKNGIQQILEGVWKNTSRALINHYGKEQFGFKSYNQAAKIIMGESGDFVNNITLTERMNEKFGINDMDINRIVERMMSDKTGFMHFESRWMFWMSTAPDYFNRMALLLAQMIEDGAYDAHTLDSNEVMHYDWTKDKRFEIYARGDKSHPEYAKQRGHYLTMLHEFNQSGMRREDGKLFVEGDALPQAYTVKEIESLKSFGNMLYGYYDHVDKMMLKSTWMGSMWLQFMTFWSSKKNQYFLPRNVYQWGRYVSKKDENGNQLYVKYNADGEGGFELEITTENTGTELVMWEGRIQEGIFVSLVNGFLELYNNGSEGFMENFWNDEIRRNNVKQFGYDLLVWTLLGILMTMFIKQLLKARNAGLKEK